MSSCSIKQCSARRRKNQPALSFHRFPKSEVLLRKWLKAIGAENINARHKDLFICSLHFEESQFSRTLDVIRLRDNAVPTLFNKILIVVYVTTSPYPVVEVYKEEESYNDPASGAKMLFPNIEDPSSVDLSVVVPAYNEEERLPPMLNEALEYLEDKVKENPAYKYEIIVVSDGSKDQTVKVTESYAAKYGSEKVRCLELVKNRGKGGAVRLGVQRTRGEKILFADADGATKFEDFSKLDASLEQLVSGAISERSAIVIGSRAHLEKESLANRSIFRNILMYGFHFLVWLFTVKGIRDTQCGFKLFTRRAARECFSSLHVNRWAFDVELLYIAQRLNIPIHEVPVRWTEIDGSKVTPVLSWIQMGCDLGLIWLKYKTGAWKIRTDKSE